MSENLPPEGEALLRGAVSSYVLSCLIKVLDKEHPGLKEQLLTMALSNVERIDADGSALGDSRADFERLVKSIIK